MTKRTINLGVEVELSDPEKFLLVKESLTRIGIASFRTKTLYQTAHILHKRGKYYICHFKELFVLDGQESYVDDEDIGRRNLICGMLQDWGLLKVVDETEIERKSPIGSVKVLSFKDKSEWNLRPKYKLGQVRFGERSNNFNHREV